MGFTDSFGQFLSAPLKINFRNRSWKRLVFLTILNMILINSWILFQGLNMKTIEYKLFLRLICEGLKKLANTTEFEEQQAKKQAKKSIDKIRKRVERQQSKAKSVSFLKLYSQNQNQLISQNSEESPNKKVKLPSKKQ